MRGHLFALCILFCTSAFAEKGMFSDLDQLLGKYVVVAELPGGGLQTAFDYEKAAKDKATVAVIESQKAKLKSFNPKVVNSKNEAISFWINSYNFFMLSAVIERGIKNGKLLINSVKDRKDGFGTLFNRYKVFQSEVHNIGGKNYSLDQMEKGQLLGTAFKKKGWKDARIHFSVNCASVGCPPLLAKAYQPETLDQDLTDNVKKALKTKRHLKVDGKTLRLTQLFEWYKGDFVEAEGSVKGFLKKYIEDKELFKKLQATSKIEYIKYDWNLNTPKNL